MSHPIPTRTVTVSVPPRPSHGYEVRIEEGSLSRLGEALACLRPSCSVLLLTDDRVNALYGDVALESLAAAGFSVIRHVIPHGEASKSAEHLISLLELMASSHMTRADLVVTLGGGVVGDLGGFAAAIYQRGIDFVQVPTTLLAMVDASVGGKTAIDLAAGKNLAGVFHQPALVLCDPDLLSTLPPETLADGMAEVIKYALINDRTLFELLEATEPAHLGRALPEIIRLCVEDKRVLVEADETDRGARQLLNLGHTVGHAIEVCSSYAVSHGSGVAMGMVIITRAAEVRGVCVPGTTEALVGLLHRFGLPTDCPFTTEELYAAALSDKKRAGGFITLAVPYAMADTRLVTVPLDALEGYIRVGLEG